MTSTIPWMAMASSSFLELTWFMRAATTAATSRGLVIARRGSAADGGTDCCSAGVVVSASLPMGFSLMATMVLARCSPGAGRSRSLDRVDSHQHEVGLVDGAHAGDAGQRHRGGTDRYKRAVEDPVEVGIDQRDQDVGAEGRGSDPEPAHVHDILAPRRVSVEAVDAVRAEGGLEHEGVVPRPPAERVVPRAAGDHVV